MVSHGEVILVWGERKWWGAGQQGGILGGDRALGVRWITINLWYKNSRRTKKVWHPTLKLWPVVPIPLPSPPSSSPVLLALMGPHPVILLPNQTGVIQLHHLKI